jgi:hypothetical protein
MLWIVVFCNSPEDGSVIFFQNVGNYHNTTQCHNPEDQGPHFQYRENLKSQQIILRTSLPVVKVIAKHRAHKLIARY